MGVVDPDDEFDQFCEHGHAFSASAPSQSPTHFNCAALKRTEGPMALR